MRNPHGRRRWLRGSPVLLAVLLATGCASGGSGASGTPEPTTPSATPSRPTPSPTPTPTTTTATQAADLCTAEVGSDGNRSLGSITGFGSLARNGDRYSVDCADGPMIGMSFDPDSAQLLLELDGTQTRIGDGETAAVGPYEVRVTEVDEDSVIFEFGLSGG